MAIGIYVIFNGIITFSPDSVARNALWNIVGSSSIIIPIWQILSGLSKLVGVAINKANIEAFGLISVSSMFIIRAIALLSDNDITLQDINSVAICTLIVASNIIRLSQILFDFKFVYIRLPIPDETK